MSFPARRPPRLAMLGLTLALSACVHRDIVIDPGEAVLRTDFVGSQASDAPASRLRAQTRNILVLTSGGADGAFGAGVLAAWTASGKRPQFDIVSGTSTGALQATAAFLGPEYDSVLERIYTSVRTQDILRSNGLKTLLGTGMYDPLPLRRLLMDAISEEMLDAVASAHAAGRRLYVTTTDMTAGKAVIWNMGAIAAGTDSNRKAQYIDVLVASAAVPGLIEPVYVRDRRSGLLAVHSDGGVKTPVPLESFMLDRRAAPRTDVWVVANGHVSRDTALRSEARSTLRLAQRGISQLIRQLMYASVRDAEARTRQAGARFHLIALPETVPEAVNPLDFKPEEMLGLYEAGRDTGLRRFGSLQAAR